MQKITFSLILFLLSGILALPAVAQSNFYWRLYSENNNLANPTNWVTDLAEVNLPNPTSIPGTYPQQNDNVFFTVAPNNPAHKVLTTTATPVNWTNLTCTAPEMFTITTNTTYNIYGNIQSNGNLQFRQSATLLFAIGTINMIGTQSATIDLGPNPVYFGSNFNINKAGGAVVELINNDFNREGTTSTFTLTAGSFTGNGKNIRASDADFVVLPTDLTGTTLTLFGSGNSYFRAAGFYNCDVVSSNAWIHFANAINTSVRLKSLLINHLTACVFYFRSSGHRLVIDHLIIDTPSLKICPYFPSIYAPFDEITISNKLTIQRASDIVIGAEDKNISRIATFNVNDIEVLPTSCEARSTIKGYTNINFNLTGDPLTTSNLTYKNLNFAGAVQLTASPEDDGGLNRGNVNFGTAPAPQNFYWIGGAGNWNVAANWSQIGFGGTPAACPPTVNDNVFFSDNAGTPYTVTLPVSTACNSITWTDAAKMGTLAAATTNVSLSVKGNADFSGANRVNPILYFVGNDPPGNYTVNSGNMPVYNNQVFFACQGTYTLESDLRMANPLETTWRALFYHTSGELISGGYEIEVGRFASEIYPAGSTRILNLFGSEIKTYYSTNSSILSPITIYLNNSGMDSYNFFYSHFRLITDPSAVSPGKNMTVNGNFNFWNITFENALGANNLNFDVATNTIKRLAFTGDGTMGSYGFSVDTLILAPHKTYTLPSFGGTGTAEINRTVTINDTLITNTNDCTGLILRGNNGTATNTTTNRGIIVNNTGDSISIGASTVTNIDWRSPTMLGVSNGVDGGTAPPSNINVDIAEGAPNVWYWVGDGGNWSDPSHWSSVSGVWTNPGGCIPLPRDTVYFDGGSFTQTGQQVTLDLAVLNIASMFWMDEAGEQLPTFVTGANRIDMSGSLRLAEGMTVTGSGFWQFTGTEQEPYSQFIETNGVVIPKSVQLLGTGRFDLKGDVTTRSSFQLGVREYSVVNFFGKFYTHGFDIRATSVSEFRVGQTGFIDLSTSTIHTTNANQNWIIADCNNVITEEAHLISVNSISFASTTCPVRFKTITTGSSTSTLSGSTIPANTVSADKISLFSTSSATLTGHFVADTLVFNSHLTITAGGTVLIKDTLEVVSTDINQPITPCNKKTISGSTTERATLIFEHCNPEIVDVDLLNINVVLPDASECGGIEQKLMVYGADLGNNSDNIIFQSRGPGEVILPKRTVTCVPHELNLVRGDIIGSQWRKNGEIIPANQGGTGRTLLVSETAIYTQQVTYAAGCIGTLVVEVEFTDRFFVWNGSNDNWNDTGNWEDRSGTAKNTLPDPCSYVIIPGGLNYYPVLLSEDLDALPIIPAAVCDTIEFRFGGEVKNTHLLTYNAAKVEMEVQSNQWYMLSAPLQQIYSGDYYVNTPNPIHDHTNGLMVYMMHFHVVNPQHPTAQLIEHDWNNAFNTNDVRIDAGQGFALYSNPRGSDWDEQEDLSFWFPKPESFHYYYSQLGAPTGRGGDLLRNKSSRFIYEDAIDSNGFVTLKTSKVENYTDTLVLVGNPFMTHIDFDLFAERNTALIYDEYRLAYGPPSPDLFVNQMVTYKKVGGDWLNSDPGSDELDNLIAPMQSFIVTSRGTLATSPTDSLKVHAEEDTQTNPGNTLRSGQVQNMPVLNVFANNGNQKSKTIIAHLDGASNAFHAEEDSRRLFPKEDNQSVLIYSLSSDNFALDINSIGDMKEPIALGFRTTKKGRVTLDFSGMESFKNTDIILHDTKENRIINLKEEDEYVFFKMDNEIYVNDRFLISFKEIVSITDLDIPEVFVSNPERNTIRIYSPQTIEAVEILDVDGRILQRETNLTSTKKDFPVSKSGIYLVKITGNEYSVIKKVVVK
jgi:hypothetical protein